MARPVKKRKPCQHCGGPKEAGQQHFCLACDNAEVRAERIRATKKRNKDKAQAVRTAEREGRPLAERKRVWRKDIPEGLGWCSRCKQLKPVEQFLAKKSSGSYCKKCRAIKAHATRLKGRYGLTPEEYQALLELQDGRCYICHNRPGVKRLSVDHDHKCCAGEISCGECIRGLLCTRCNQYLGDIRDNVDAMRRGVEYLLSPPAQRNKERAA